MSQGSYRRWILLGVFLLVATSFLCITLGAMEISIEEVGRILMYGVTKNESLIQDIPLNKVLVVLEIRLPRVVTSIAVGIGLSLSGTIFQGILGNPLADPYTIGVSTGAAFGASLIIVMNMFFLSVPLPILPFAMLGAFTTLLAILRITKLKGSLGSESLILSGIIVSSILSAGISFLKVISGEGVSAIVFWLMGSLASTTRENAIIVVIVVAAMMIFLMHKGDELDILSLGKKEAQSLGVDVDKSMKSFLLMGAVLTATCVSVSGIIGFVGLVIPHMVRIMFTRNHRHVLGLSAVYGGLLLLITDNIARLLTVVEIPVGVYMALLGGPFFLYLYVKKDERLT